MIADTCAEKQQVMGLYFCAEVKDFEILVQVREFDDLAEVKVFGAWDDVAEFFQSLGQSL